MGGFDPVGAPNTVCHPLGLVTILDVVLPSIGKQQQVINLVGKCTVDGVCISLSCMRLLVGFENNPFDFSLCSNCQCVSSVEIHRQTRFAEAWLSSNKAFSNARRTISGPMMTFP